MSRYRDAYLVARTIVTVGGVVKGIGIFLAIVITLAAFVVASQSGQEANWGRTYLLLICHAHWNGGVSVTMERPLTIRYGMSFRELRERGETQYSSAAGPVQRFSGQVAKDAKIAILIKHTIQQINNE